MALPINPVHVYTLTIPSTKKEFKYRPFLVAEQKSLLIAQQSSENSVMYDTIKEVIKACAKSEVDVDKLASFDIEYMFLQLRANSVGELVDLYLSCEEDHGDEQSKAVQDIKVDVRDAKVEEFEGHVSKIPLFNDVGVVMKYPNIQTLKKIETLDDDNLDKIIDIVIDCIDYIYDSDEIYSANDQTRQELTDFLNNLSPDQFTSIQKFFTTMPKLRLHVTYTCPLCNKEYKRFFEGLSSFF